MRTVEVSRVVDAPPSHVAEALDPTSVIEYEGSFSVFDVERRENDWLVVAGGTGLRLVLRFERYDNGIFYEQEEAEGQPLETMTTTITYLPAGGNTEVTAVSEVSMGVRPRALTDRLAAWKRRGELKRALRALEADLSRD